MANKVTPEMIERINELYLTIKTYSGVSRALGGSPSPTTVKKYIIPNFIPRNQVQVKKFSGNIPECPIHNINEISLSLTEEEAKEIEELKLEMVV